MTCTLAPACLLKPDAWLSETIGRAAYRLVLDDAPPPSVAGIRAQVAAVEPAAVFIDAAVPTTDVAAGARLQACGFQLVDTAVVFEQAAPAVPAPTDPRIRRAHPGDAEAVAALAGRSFTCSRFHRDPHFPAALADLVKARWAANYFNGARGDALWVAEHGGRVAGFNLVCYGSGSTHTIDLIAVDAAARRRGLAGALLRKAAHEAHLQGAATLRVGTQVSNVASVRLYEQHGFRMKASRYIYHYHQPSWTS